ncbi:hemolymph lipopolysaccharide-binding protein-like [Neodiprion fabricii]|uniref:hemolymph lipopolysaccharide-binding protein-like n=1 Tax=Neodiprion fabricii TaxID=2872261 RepID=UPI001ED93EC2|nr:hemolymph lipopolysaccharide-binding protein-like [Neodiprion fabricii]
MWKLLVILFFGGVFGGPLENGSPLAFKPDSVETAEEPCHCPSSLVSSAQIESPTVANRPLLSSGTGTRTNSLQNLVYNGMPCVCSFGPSRIPIRDDYIYTPGIGSHKLHTRALVWNDARKVCNDEGGHLAIINSVSEARVLMDIFNKSTPVKGAAYDHAAYLGIHDLYKEGEWVTISGESLAQTGYTKWTDKWGGQPDNGDGKQNCGVLYKEGGMDDVFCEAAFAYFCELPTIQFVN